MLIFSVELLQALNLHWNETNMLLYIKSVFLSGTGETRQGRLRQTKSFRFVKFEYLMDQSGGK